MLASPFGLFRPLEQHLRLALFTKDDDIRSDADAASILGATEAAGLHQVHGTRTMRVDGPLPRTEEADGMVTSAPGLALCIRWADCQNFIVYAPQRNVAGVLHAGWRGLQAGAIPAFFHTLEREWGILPADTIVGAGPSLCQRCSTFSRPAEELPSLYPRFFDANHADLQGAATDQLLALGVEARNIERHPDCTCCDPETYWTSRGGHREEVQAGRTNMLAVVLL